MKSGLLAAVAAGGLLLAAPASAQGVKIGILNDQSGVYADYGGKWSFEAAKMAVEDFGGEVLGHKIEIVSADHQNKPDLATAIARRWYDVEGVDMITELTTSSVALAVQDLSKEKKKIDIVVGAATSRLTGDACQPYGFHWAYDTHALAVGTGGALVEAGGDTWFFLTADYAFGYALEKDTGDFVKAKGGKVLGAVRIPLNSSDFSSFLLQAQSSKAKIIGLANAGLDTTNSIKQAAEFGIVKSGQKLAGLLLTLAEVHGLGLEAAQGLVLTEGYYWDRDDKSRDLAERFFKRTGRMPNMIQAGTYSATLQLSEGGQGRRHQGHRGGRQEAEGAAGRRRLRARRQGAGKRPHGARPLSVRGQEAVGIEEAVGLLQAARRGAGRQGVPGGEGLRLPADEVGSVVPANAGPIATAPLFALAFTASNARRMGPAFAGRRGDERVVPHACTIRHTIAPIAPTHRAIAASAWIAKPGPRL